MTHWYGARFAEQYGAAPPPDWCAIVDGTTNQSMTRALAEIKMRHAIHPPTLPEFDAIASKQTRTENAGPSMQERLADHVLKHRALTFHQTRSPWSFITVNGQAVAVDVPADGEAKGFRVRAEDMPQ
jgi:hypothetical protein